METIGEDGLKYRVQAGLVGITTLMFLVGLGYLFSMYVLHR